MYFKKYMSNEASESIRHEVCLCIFHILEVASKSINKEIYNHIVLTRFGPRLIICSLMVAWLDEKYSERVLSILVKSDLCDKVNYDTYFFNKTFNDILSYKKISKNDEKNLYIRNLILAARYRRYIKMLQVEKISK